jgi:hypothetical protein
MEESTFNLPEQMPIMFGACCACRGIEDVNNVVILDRKGPTPGQGWGCYECGLPSDGAIAVICNACIESGRALVEACTGLPTHDGRTPVSELAGRYGHKPWAHENHEALIANAHLN